MNVYWELCAKQFLQESCEVHITLMQMRWESWGGVMEAPVPAHRAMGYREWPWCTSVPLSLSEVFLKGHCSKPRIESISRLSVKPFLLVFLICQLYSPGSGYPLTFLTTGVPVSVLMVACSRVGKWLRESNYSRPKSASPCLKESLKMPMLAEENDEWLKHK